jgi:hypothetical protein
MDTKVLITSLNRQVASLYKQRHPQKGVVVKIDNFHDMVERRKKLMTRLRDHETVMDALRQRRVRLGKNERRFAHIREALTAGRSMVSLSVRWVDDRPVGFTIIAPQGVEKFDISDGIQFGNGRLKRLAREHASDYITTHDLDLLNSNLALAGYSVPIFERSIDIAQISRVLYGTARSSIQMGAAVGVDRDAYGEFGAFLLAVADRYVWADSLESCIKEANEN